MDEKRRLRVADKIWETEDSATFVLEPTDGKPLRYRPGQYLPLIFESLGREKRRAYSFSSCPGVDPLPAITVKRVPNGEFSNALLRHVQPGDPLLSGEPAGQFLLPETLPPVLVYLAGGSGITPVVSHLKALLDREGPPSGHPPPQIVLYYASRNSPSTLFKRRLDAWAEAFPGRFQCTYFLSREKDTPRSHFGHLNNALFEHLLLERFGGKIPPGTGFFLCAPLGLMRMAEMTLRVLEVPETAIRKEAFLADTRLPVRTVEPDITHRIVVTAAGRSRSFEVFEGETILNGALRQGIELPYTCKSGVCFSCLARCVRGEIDVTFVHATRRVGPGQLVQTCIGYAVSEEVEISF
jgi:ring-1,2-phenylacetyl-CoA epoxidase subunit PaaE